MTLRGNSHLVNNNMFKTFQTLLLEIRATVMLFKCWCHLQSQVAISNKPETNSDYGRIDQNVGFYFPLHVAAHQWGQNQWVAPPDREEAKSLQWVQSLMLIFGYHWRWMPTKHLRRPRENKCGGPESAFSLFPFCLSLNEGRNAENCRNVAGAAPFKNRAT